MTGIAGHTKHSNLLRPPLNKLPGPMALTSWIDDHMPEMLWAALIRHVFGQERFIACMREIISVASPWFETLEPDPAVKSNPPPAPPQGGQIDDFVDNKVLDQTGLVGLSDERFRVVLDVVRRHPLGPAALRPLLLIKSLPGIDRWTSELSMEPTEADWTTLAGAIAETLDHQSQASTDVRWLKVMFRIACGGLKFPRDMANQLREYIEYPDRGEQRSVRPRIRAIELMTRRRPPSVWVKDFWQECSETECIDPSERHDYTTSASTIDRASLYAARLNIVARFYEVRGSLRVDARLDGAFGLALYALSLADEVATNHSQSLVLGRLALRSLSEVVTTFGYLMSEDRPELWSAYRVYGAGQAKLAFLKAQESDGDLPNFIDEDALHAIANEDVWQEFVDINLGDWEKSDNRQRAEKGGLKNVYDKYYGWTSAFVHGNWGAVRDTNFVTCHNPLHRLHRIPRIIHRALHSADRDIVELTNTAIDRLDAAFAGVEVLPHVRLLND